uniref:uncharacterized protein LOC120331858 isoform X2 n=1 Tax=Styela clava TaxID=7725 RepID=UPI00193A30C7|nr:uncharacterized protein LOC120331858 isoform X2 [Styela clava]
MSYNYAAAYGTSYGQYAAAQPSSYSTQTPATSGYGHYGQQAASGYGTSGSATTASTTASSVSSYAGYGSTAAATTTTAQSTYNFGGYGYNYGTDATSGYSASTATNAALQAFQVTKQSWYSSPNASSGTAAAPAQQQQQQQQQQAVTSSQTASQQQYGQYIQQYQQQISAYQQYVGNTAGSTNQQQQQQQQQGLFKTPQALAAKPKTDTQQQSTGWGAYNQRQSPSAIATRTDTAKTGWGVYQQQQQQQQQPGIASQQTSSLTNQQQKPAGLVYRSPMKYSTDTQYGSTQGYTANQAYKSPAGNTTQAGYGTSSPSQGYGSSTQQQGYGTQQSQGYGNNQSSYSSPSQGGYNANQGYKSQSTGYQTGGNQGNQQTYSGNYNQGNNQGNYNRGYGQSPNNANGNVGMNNNMQGGQRGGPVRPLLTQRSPMGGGGGNQSYGGNNQGPRDGPDIPPFPRAWHSQDGYEGPPRQDNWQQQRNFGEQREQRWGRGGGNIGGGGGRFGNQQQQQQTPQPRGIYSNNSRNARGSSGSNRELWSPANKKSGTSMINKMDKDVKEVKKEFGEVIDKEKHSEIKTFLYAWLGARKLRPTYDIRQIGERPNISFRCDLRVDKYNFVGVGKAANKKEAQTTAAWKFADYLVRMGEINNSELPNKNIKVPDDKEGDIGDVKEEAVDDIPDEEIFVPKKDNNMTNRNRKGGRDRDRRNKRGNWGPAPRPLLGGGGGGGEIRPLMALPVGPSWDGPMGPPPPHLMRMPHPGMMDFRPPMWDGPPMMGPPHHMGPPHMHMRPGMPPPFMRNRQNDFWRRRDIEERMMDMSRGNDWAHPEDMFISQMIRNQQEAERKRGGSGVPRPIMQPMEAMPGEWERVQQTRPVITSDDRHMMTKHAEIYPQEGELKNLHRIVNTVEQALKLLSDKFVNEDHPKEEPKKEEPEKMEKDETKKEGEEEKKESQEAIEEKKETEGETSVENKEEKKDESEKKDEEEKKEGEEKKEEKRAKIKILKRPKKTPKQVDTRPRVLCGVNRIGPLAKGLLITKDDHVELALLCGEIPTIKLLDRIMEHIDEKLFTVDEDFKLNVIKMEEEAGFLIKSVEDTPVEVMVTLTAMALRKPAKKEAETKKESKKDDEENDNKEEKETTTAEEPDPEGMLPKAKMLEALACLRHTQWFQAKACSIQSCVILTRILRDLQRRDEMWSHIAEWPLEVLIYSCLSSSEEQMSPGDACRRFFEVLAGGLLLPGMPGVADPCEKASLQRDVLDCLTVQHREEITTVSQKYLRQIAFREIHFILGMEKLSPSFKMDNHSNHQNKYGNKNQSTDVKQDAEVEKERPADANNARKRRFEHNGNDSVAESPKRSLTDEEDTDTQQNLAELSISDEASENRTSGGDQTETDKDQTPAEEDSKQPSKEEEEDVMETAEDSGERELTKEEEDALLEEENMDT